MVTETIHGEKGACDLLNTSNLFVYATGPKSMDVFFISRVHNHKDKTNE
jgi:hypothetical protein